MDRAKAQLFGDAVRGFGEARTRLQGSSMLPALWPGDELTVRRRAVSEVEIGEIAVFARHDRVIAHRVTARRGACLVTRGDAVPAQDEPVSGAELLGVVVSASRRGVPVKLPAKLSVPGRLVAALARRSPRASSVIQRGRALLIGRPRVRSRVTSGSS